MISLKRGWDPIWERIFREQEWGKYPPEHVIRFVARHFYRSPQRENVRLLDLGCGTGACSWFIAREGLSVSGIDGSASAIERARDRFATEGLSGEFTVGDFAHLPWADETFDGAIENVALCCNPYELCREAVAELYRVLKPGGRFVSCSFTDSTWGATTARNIGLNEYVDFQEGPLLDRGFGLLMDRDQVSQLFDAFDNVVLEKISRTVDDLQHVIECWVIEGQKPISA